MRNPDYLTKPGLRMKPLGTHKIGTTAVVPCPDYKGSPVALISAEEGDMFRIETGRQHRTPYNAYRSSSGLSPVAPCVRNMGYYHMVHDC